MQANNTINPGAVDATDFEMADPLMQAMADTGFEGMTAYQRNIVCKMAEMLDAAVKRLDAIGACAGMDAGALITLASNHALMMRKHGAILRGPKLAGLLEDLCDAVLAASKPAVASDPVPAVESAVRVIRLPESGTISVDYAVECLGCDYAAIADLLGIKQITMYRWKRKGFIPWRASQKLADISRAAA